MNLQNLMMIPTKQEIIEDIIDILVFICIVLIMGCFIVMNYGFFILEWLASTWKISVALFLISVSILSIINSIYLVRKHNLFTIALWIISVSSIWLIVGSFISNIFLYALEH